MRKPLTGEPCAGEPHARFGGRGGREPFSTPIGEAVDKRTFVLYDAVVVLHVDFHDLVRE